ncbi:hypothetical protein H8959_019521 [Pygathrix nigripes]
MPAHSSGAVSRRRSPGRPEPAERLLCSPPPPSPSGGGRTSRKRLVAAGWGSHRPHPQEVGWPARPAPQRGAASGSLSRIWGENVGRERGVEMPIPKLGNSENVLFPWSPMHPGLRGVPCRSDGHPCRRAPECVLFSDRLSEAWGCSFWESSSRAEYFLYVEPRARRDGGQESAGPALMQAGKQQPPASVSDAAPALAGPVQDPAQPSYCGAAGLDWGERGRLRAERAAAAPPGPGSRRPELRLTHLSLLLLFIGL